jgi:hypothetical protein
MFAHLHTYSNWEFGAVCDSDHCRHVPYCATRLESRCDSLDDSTRSGETPPRARLRSGQAIRRGGRRYLKAPNPALLGFWDRASARVQVHANHFYPSSRTGVCRCDQRPPELRQQRSLCSRRQTDGACARTVARLRSSRETLIEQAGCFGGLGTGLCSAQVREDAAYPPYTDW